MLRSLEEQNVLRVPLLRYRKEDPGVLSWAYSWLGLLGMLTLGISVGGMGESNR